MNNDYFDELKLKAKAISDTDKKILYNYSIRRFFLFILKPCIIK